MTTTDLADERDMRLVVSERIEPTADVVVLVLRHPDGEPLPAWTPGSHIDLVLDNDLVRQYSLCGDPSDRSSWRIGVLREPDGRGGSAHVHEHLVSGAGVDVRGPRNHFTLEPASSYVFIAGGIGVTPILSMVGEAERNGTPWIMHYGGRTLSSMAFVSELAEHGDRVKLHPQDVEGLLDLGAIMSDATDRSSVYCCGPAPLLEAAEKAAASSGLDIHVEHFTPKQVGAPVLAGSFEVVLDQMGVTLTVPPGRSILDVVEDAGAEVITSCREGTCGSCETVVLEGTPDHRDSLLSSDIDDAMMICVSRSASPRLVLDL